MTLPDDLRFAARKSANKPRLSVMATGRWSFKLCDVQRAIKAVKMERLPVSGVRIGADGSISINTQPLAVKPEGKPAVEEGRELVL
jgi:hypothetical protein